MEDGKALLETDMIHVAALRRFAGLAFFLFLYSSFSLFFSLLSSSCFFFLSGIFLVLFRLKRGWYNSRVGRDDEKLIREDCF